MPSAVDTNILIYALDDNSSFFPAAHTLLRSLEEAGDTVYASVILRTEILSGLYAAFAPHDHAHAALASFSFIMYVPVSQLIADGAAELIASNGARLKNIDALHLATAAQVGASEFWTNDFTLAKVTVPGLTIKLLADVGV